MNLWSLVLLVPVVFALVCDLRTREIPDWIPLLIVAWACLATATGLCTRSLGLALSAGALLGLGLGAAVFYLGWPGGGDVKLLAAIGAAVGPWALLSILAWMAFAGGVLALVAAAVESRILPTCRRSPSGSWWKPFGREDSHMCCCDKKITYCTGKAWDFRLKLRPSPYRLFATFSRRAGAAARRWSNSRSSPWWSTFCWAAS